MKRHCQGSFLIESVIAALLLGTASLAVMRLVSDSAKLQRRTDRETAAILTAQNHLHRLRVLPWEDLSKRFQLDLGDVAEESYREDSGCEVRLSARPFAKRSTSGQATERVEERAGREITGLHLMVQVDVQDQVRIVLHDWRLEPGDPVMTTDEVAVDQILDATETDDGSQEGAF